MLRKFMLCLLVLVLMTTLTFNFSCMTLFRGSIDEAERGDVSVGYVLISLLGGGLIGIFVDYASGAVYKRKALYNMDIEENIRHHLVNRKMPVHYFAEENIYKVTLLNDELIYTEVERDSFSPRVLKAINR